MNMKNWKIRMKLLVLISFMAAIILGVSVLGWITLQHTIDYGERTEASVREAFTGALITTSAAVLNRIEYSLAADPTEENLAAALKRIDTEDKAIEANLVELKKTAVGEQVKQIAAVEAAYRAYESELKDTLDLALLRGLLLRAEPIGLDHIGFENLQRGGDFADVVLALGADDGCRQLTLRQGVDVGNSGAQRLADAVGRQQISESETAEHAQTSDRH